MTAQRINTRLVFTTAAAAAALFLTGCGAGTPQAQTSSNTASSPASSASQPASSGAATGPASSAPAPAVSAPAAPGLCKAAGLTGTIDSTGGGAAGSVYMTLILTNSGTEPCLLKGFAGVSLTADGAPIGAAAARDESTPATDVLLAPGQAGAATLRYSQAANHPDCTMAPAAGFRVYPPEDTASLFIAQPRDACSDAETRLLTIGAFTAK
ncbi:DUF4232 domain-containing protein [Pseudarthrobacter sp. PvP090]|uniref:DUF4232 domain-containing protein n=1 Tax=Pseudarthrobacter sp. PvP090 TaxID=3156393 RepID=UPI0033933C93